MGKGGLILGAIVVLGIIGSALGQPSPSTQTAAAGATATATPTEEATEGDDPTVQPTPVPPPVPPPLPPVATPRPPTVYGKLSARGWAQVVKAPDNYIGRAYQVWACITQFDAATGEDAFRGDASYGYTTNYGIFQGDNSIIQGNAAMLSAFVKDDVVAMNVIVLGSYSYDTQIGGSTTVPSFQVKKIRRVGSCAY
jgi:hypothetical protein